MGKVLSRGRRSNDEKSPLLINAPIGHDRYSGIRDNVVMSRPVQPSEDGEAFQNKLLVPGPEGGPATQYLDRHSCPPPGQVEPIVVPNSITRSDTRCMIATSIISLFFFVVSLGFMIAYLVYPPDYHFQPYLQSNRTVQLSPPLDPFWYPQANIIYDISNGYEVKLAWIGCMDLKTKKTRYNGSISGANLYDLKDYASVCAGTVLNISVQVNGSSKPDDKASFYIVTDEPTKQATQPNASLYKQFPINKTDGAWTDFTITYTDYGTYFYVLVLPNSLSSVLKYSIDYVQLNSSGYNFTCRLSEDDLGRMSCPLEHKGLPGDSKKQCLVAKTFTMSTEPFLKIKVNFFADHMNWIFGITLALAIIFFLLFIAPPIYYPCHEYIKPRLPWC